MSSEPRSRQLRRNLPLLCGFRALQMTLFPVAIITLYMTDHLGLTMTDVFVLQALFSLFTAALEFPGGFVADRIGYRRALILACVMSLLGWCVYVVADGFALIAVAELFLAASLALTSGTDSAILYESLLELDEETEFTRWLGRSRSLGAVSEGTAALAAGLMYSIDPLLPMYAQFIVWLGNGVIALLLLEPHRAQVESQPPWSHAKRLLRFAAFHAPALRATIATVVVLGTATFVPVWIIAIYAEQAGVPLAWLGPMWAVANYSVALGNLLSARGEREFGLHTVLALSIVLVASGYAGLSLSHATLGFVFYYVLCLGRGLAGPVLNHAQQRLIPSGDRAALLSINSLLFRGSFALIGPFIGAGVDAWGNHAILGGLGAFFFTASVAVLLWLRGYPRIGLAPTTEEDAEPVP